MTDGQKNDVRQPCRSTVHDHYPSVYRFLLHMTRDQAVAEDLTQETFTVAWQKKDTFEGRSTAGTWLYRIAYRKFIDYARKRQAEVRFTEKMKIQKKNGPSVQDPMDPLLADERSRQLYLAVQGLDEEERTLIVLHYLQGRSFGEMSEITDQPVGTIKWRVSRALSRLRDRMVKRKTV